MALPVLIGIGAILASIGKWFVEMALMYGRKVAFYSIAVSLFFAILYTVSTAVFATFDSLSGSSYFANISPYTQLVAAVFPSNFLSVAALMISIEFQIFFWRWAMKVLDIKVNFFGS